MGVGEGDGDVEGDGEGDGCGCVSPGCEYATGRSKMLSHKKAQKAQTILLIVFVPFCGSGLISSSKRRGRVSVLRGNVSGPSATTLRDRWRPSRVRRYSITRAATLRKTRACGCCKRASRTLPGRYPPQRSGSVREARLQH